MRVIYFLCTIFILSLITGCQWGPKEREFVIPGTPGSNDADHTGLYFDLHRIKVLKKLPAENYVYLQVEEGERNFWIAVRKGNIHVDSIYYYREALLKTNFESKLQNQVFDSIYLVTQLVPERHFNITSQ